MEELVKRAQKGSKEAFEQLVLENQNGVYSFCLRMTKNREDAYDLSQEAFIKTWRALDSFKGESSFSTWLYRLTSNVCIDFLRRRKNEKVVSLSFAGENGVTKTADIADSDPTPEEQAEKNELRSEIGDALMQLSADHRQVLIMREINSLSYQEIADALEISVGTVKSRISRARREMCVYLKNRRNFFGGEASNIAERE